MRTHKMESFPSSMTQQAGAGSFSTRSLPLFEAVERPPARLASLQYRRFCTNFLMARCYCFPWPQCQLAKERSDCGRFRSRAAFSSH